MPLPTYGFDPTEAAIPWQILRKNGIQVQFATPQGKSADCDKRMLLGTGLGIWKPLLIANSDAREAYENMVKSLEFQNPLTWNKMEESEFDGLLLPGGHDKGVKEYLESVMLQNVVRDFFEAGKVIGAICHGVVLAARSKHANGDSVIKGFKTTALLANQELLAYRLTKAWLGDYYLTYPGLTVEAEVKQNLQYPEDFQTGSTPILRDSPKKLNRGFCVQDRNYVSARWPGDAHLFAETLVKLLKNTP